MKKFIVTLEVSIEADSLAEAKTFADMSLSVVDHEATIYDVHECRVVEAQ